MKYKDIYQRYVKAESNYLLNILSETMKKFIDIVSFSMFTLCFLKI